jgi:CDP-diacylglycerol--glycerol-3-phosphate 3-phosphatidyltransferase
MFLAVVMTGLLAVEFPFSICLALVVFIVASITDYYDGKLARGEHGITTFGKFMDPLADKLLVAAAFICFVGEPMGHILPAWVVVVIIAREFMVTGLRLLAIGEGKVIAAGKWGKHKTVWQITAIIIIMLGVSLEKEILPAVLNEDVLLQVEPVFELWFGRASTLLAVLVAGITVFSGWVYLKDNMTVVMKEV